MRMFLATLLAKCAYILLRILGRNASHFPGAVALKVCPDYLKRVRKPALTVCVTGTNGKTTVTNMAADLIEMNGKKIMSNRLGSNITQGVTTAYVRSVSLFGNPKVDAMVLEVDERASRLIFPFIEPDYIVVTNLFRDSLMRNAHPEYIFDILDTYIPDRAHLILNADDTLSSRLKIGNTRTYFSVGRQPGDVTECVNRVSDNVICPECQTRLEYEYLHYHHLGKYRCPSCGYSAPEALFTAKTVDAKAGTLTVSDGQTERTYHLINDALYNVYNETALITLARVLGYDDETVMKTIENIHITDTRLREFSAGGVDVICALSKGCNSVACSRNFDNVRQHPGKKAVYLALDDNDYRKNSVEFDGWIYDVDYEFLNDPDILQVVVGGPRCYDHRLRLLMAGVSEDRISVAEDELLTDDSDLEEQAKLEEMLDNQLSESDEDIMDDLGLDMNEILRTMAEQAKKLPKDER